jgi:hypothetical protein
MDKRLKEIRRLVADLMSSSGCGCCRNYEKYEKTEGELAEMLHVPRYEDDSGWDFNQFSSNPVNLNWVQKEEE